MIQSQNTLPAVCLAEDEAQNQHYPLPGVLPAHAYLVMGEVAHEVSERGAQATLQGISHYILLDMSSGRILPGMFHADRFRYVKDSDPFF